MSGRWAPYDRGRRRAEPDTILDRHAPARLAAEPVGQAALPRGHHLGLHPLVDRPRPHRRAVLVQRDALPNGLGLLLVPLVLGDPVDSVWHDPTLRHALLQSFKLAGADVLIAVPLGVLLALGLARWRGRGSGTSNFIMLFPLVTPEIVMGVSLLLVFSHVFTFVHTGTVAQILGHVTFSISFVVVIVRGRLFSIGRQYEEAAADLGASPFVALRSVLLPLLMPAIVASAAVVFAISADDFVLSQWLSSGGPTDTVPIQIYAATRAAPLPSVNAIATIMLVSTLLIVTAGFLTWRFFTRGERRSGKAAEDFGGAFNIT